jgi:aminoglycoside phosphotransferase (APT) family kinase protein
MPVPTTRTVDETRRLLTDWLRERIDGASDVEVSDIVAPKENGFSSETLMFDARWRQDGREIAGRYVARVEATGYSVFPDIDLRQQYEVLAALRDTPIPVPRVLCFQESEGSPFGQAFFVMAHVAGRIPADHPPYAVKGWLADAGADAQAEVYWNTLDMLADLHGLDWRTLGVDGLLRDGGAAPGMAAELDNFQGYLDWVLDGRENPVLAGALAHLRGAIPADEPLALNWGDPKVSNVIFDGTRPVAVLDWELAAIAPPVADLAFFFVLHRANTQMRGHANLAGFPEEDRAVARYEERTGRAVQHLHYHKVWSALRITTILLRLGDMFIRAGKLDPDPARGPHQAPQRLLQELLEQA